MEKETSIVYQNNKKIWILYTEPTQPRIFMWKKSLAKRELEPRPSRMLGECSVNWASFAAGINQAEPSIYSGITVMV